LSYTVTISIAFLPVNTIWLLLSTHIYRDRWS